jgi:hypothetical protein
MFLVTSEVSFWEMNALNLYCVFLNLIFFTWVMNNRNLSEADEEAEYSDSDSDV